MILRFLPDFSAMPRRALGVATFLLLLAMTAMAAAQQRAPNVIFILTDDQRYDELGVTGHPVMKTPHLDALARRGAVFQQFFTTTAVCLPSRVNYVTGKWERSHTVGFRGERALSDEQWRDSLFGVLRQAGYFTGLIGKSNIPGLRQDDIDYYCGSDRTYLGFYPREQHRDFEVLFHGATETTQIEIIGEAARDFLGTDDGFYQRSLPAMKKYLGRRDRSKPFFLYLPFEVPHGTGTRTMERRPTDDELYRSAYRDRIDDMPLPDNYVALSDWRTPKLPLEIYNGEQSDSYSYRRTPEGVHEQMVRNCQTITGIDRLVGRLRAQLEELGEAGNTIILFGSDHGWMHGEWGYGGKCLLYEPSIHVPFIVYDPRPESIRRGTRIRELAGSPDVAPTILDLCGIKPPESMQGRSLVPLMRRADAQSVEWRKDIFLECLMLGQNYPLVQGVRGERWKYMRYWPLRPVPDDYRDMLNFGLHGEKPAYEELYDLEADPLENHNLADSPPHAARLEEMRARCVEALRESLGRAPTDPMPSITVEEWRKRTGDFYRMLRSAKK